MILHTHVCAHRCMYTHTHYTHTFCLHPIFFLSWSTTNTGRFFPTPAVKFDWGTAFSCYVYTLWMQSSYTFFILCFMLNWMKIFSAMNLFLGGFKTACMKSVKVLSLKAWNYLMKAKGCCILGLFYCCSFFCILCFTLPASCMCSESCNLLF